MDGKTKIEKILAELQLKAPTFAKNIGVKYSRIQDIERKKTKKITAEVAIAISKTYPQYDLNWLMQNENETIINQTKQANSTLPGQKCTNPDCLNKIKQLTDELAKANDDINFYKGLIKHFQGTIEQLQAGKGALPPEKRDSGSVEEPGENKKAS